MRICKLCKAKTAGLIINLNAFCSLDHAIEWANANAKKAREKDNAKRTREYKENNKATWERRAVKACHRYIRLRDAVLPCVSCGRHHTGKYDAGHYRPSGVNSALRYDERNIHKQCSPCNTHKSGNLPEYRKTLIERVGLDVVEWLDANHEIKRWTQEELKEVYQYYTGKIKELESGRN